MLRAVSDTSCMTDLRKAGILDASLRLPYVFVMPKTMFDDEWLCPNKDERDALREMGLDAQESPIEFVRRATKCFEEYGGLDFNDCLALVFAEAIGGSILSTGDASLRKVAEGKGIEVHGVLWAIDEMNARKTASPQVLHDALSLFREDRSVFLPADEIRRRMNRLARML